MSLEWKFDKRIIFVSSGDDWTWDDADQFLHRLRTMLESVSHPVHLIKYLRPEFRLPPGGFMEYVQREMQLHREAGVMCVYHVCKSHELLTLIQAAIQRNGGSTSQYVTLTNLDEAFEQARSRFDNVDNDDVCGTV